MTRLRRDGASVWGLSSRRDGDGAALRADVRRPIEVEAAMMTVRPTHVFHLAALRERSRDWSRLSAAMAVNAFGTACVVASAARVGAQRVVVMGTVDEYGPIPVPYREGDAESPRTVYGITKLAGTRAALEVGEVTGVEVSVLRGSVAYGPGQPEDMFLGSLLAALVAGREFAMTSGDQLRDFVYVDDLVEGLCLAAREKVAAGRILNIASGESVPIHAVAHLAKSLTAGSGTFKLGAMPPRDGEVSDYAVATNAAVEVLGWKPRVPLEEGLRTAIRALR